MSDQFRVVEVSQKQIAGVHVHTDITNAQKDCPALWQSFSAGGCAGLSDGAEASAQAPGDYYGVSVMLDESRFIYWAAAEVNPAKTLPQGLEAMTIPAGLYVKCTVPSLEKLGEAYMALYTQWPQSQNDYALNRQGLCFELYGHDWNFEDPFELYASVIKKP